MPWIGFKCRQKSINQSSFCSIRSKPSDRVRHGPTPPRLLSDEAANSGRRKHRGRPTRSSGEGGWVARKEAAATDRKARAESRSKPFRAESRAGKSVQESIKGGRVERRRPRDDSSSSSPLTCYNLWKHDSPTGTQTTPSYQQARGRSPFPWDIPNSEF